jgi:hypothetical protein
MNCHCDGPDLGYGVRGIGYGKNKKEDRRITYSELRITYCHCDGPESSRDGGNPGLHYSFNLTSTIEHVFSNNQHKMCWLFSYIPQYDYTHSSGVGFGIIFINHKSLILD